jgi:hypothetical protein
MPFRLVERWRAPDASVVAKDEQHDAASTGGGTDLDDAPRGGRSRQATVWSFGWDFVIERQATKHLDGTAAGRAGE